MNEFVKKTIASFMVGIVTLYTLPVYAMASSESVYSKLKANGENYQTIVTTKENEEVKQENIKKELPIETKITYKLNGGDISAEDLVGKSGKVSIKIEYINKSCKTVSVNGTNQNMYTPFIVAVGTIIDNENNKNIEVKNGKIIENGGKSIVVGVVMPGLKDSLSLTGELENIEIPSSIEITMDSENFEMKNIVSYSSPKLLDKDINWNKFDNLFSSANLLQNSANQLEDGANELAKGTNTLKEGATTLADGIASAYDGSSKIKNQVSNSIKNIDNDNTKALTEKTLNIISKQASNLAVESVKTQLNTIGANAANAASDSIKDNLNTIGENASTQAVKNIKSKENIIASQAEQAAKNTMPSMEKELFEKIKKYVLANQASLIPADKVRESAENAINNNATKVVTDSATAGVKAASEIAEKSINSIQANSGEIGVDISNISINIDYESVLNKNSKYANLSKEEKELVKSVLEETTKTVKNEAEKQAKTAANNAAQKATKKAETSAKLSAQNAIQQIAASAAGIAAKTAATEVTTNMIGTAVNAGVQESMNQLMKNLANNSSILENAILPYVGKIANQTAKSVAETVASQTAQATATQVAESVASKTAQSVAIQVTANVAENTAKTVADEVADEVKASAMTQIKAQMTTLLNEGMIPLTSGLEKMNNGAKALNTGAKQLEEGSKAIAEGMHKFNNEGIKKIVKIINIDFGNLVERGKKLEQLSKEYESFSSEGKQENVKFISIIDSVRTSQKEEDKQEINIDEKK